MVVGVAGAVEGARRIGLAAAGLTLAFGHPAARAQEAPPPSVVSRTCDVPASDISDPAPLPRTVAKLRERTVLRVLAIGSSSTAGVGATTPKANYPAQFESIVEKNFKGLDVVIVNRGVSGEPAATTSERLKLQVAQESPDLVLWQVGTNDALARVPVEEFAGTIRSTIRWLKEHDVDVVLVGLQYTPSVARDEHYAAIRASLHRIAVSENVILVRRFEAMEHLARAKSGELLAGDGLHLNDLGYRCMAEHVASAVVVSAFLKRPPAGSPLP
jgi:lysophospholipase L1-like esterase